MIYGISFRIEQVGDHYERYQSFVERVEKEAVGGTTWDETTSFIIIESTKSTSELTSALYMGSKISSKDLLLVINLSHKSHDTRGDFKYPATLAGLMSRR